MELVPSRMAIASNHPSAIPAGSGWKSTGTAIVFWLLAAIGVVVMVGAWFLLAIAGLEEITEQPKALAAGTTMAGTTFLLGVLPLIAVHLAGFAIVMPYGAYARHERRSGLWLGAAVVVCDSVIGLAGLLLFLYA